MSYNLRLNATTAVMTLAWCLLPASAHAEVDAVLKQALALHADGKAADAFALLSPLQTSRASDPDFDYELGLAATDSGHRGAAIIALQRVLAVQPGNAQARAEIARAYALAGDIDTARAEFNTVVNDPSIPDPVRQRFDQLVRDYDKTIKGGGSSVTGFADIESGYDSNINTATSLTSITLPAFAFFGPAALTGPATKIDDGFVQGQLGVSGKFGIDRQTSAFASVLGLYRGDVNHKAFNQAALTGTLGVSHTLATPDVLSLSGQVQHFRLGNAAYRTSYGAIGQYTHQLDGGRALSLTAQYSYLNYNTDALRDADRYGATASYAGSMVYASLGGGREAPRKAAGKYLAYVFGNANVVAQVPINKLFDVTGTLGVEHRRYEANDPLFLATRVDTQFDASATVRYRLTKWMSVAPKVSYTQNFSKFALYSYKRVTGSLALRAEF